MAMDTAALLDMVMKAHLPVPMTQAQLARLTGVTQATICRTLQGRTVPSGATLEKLASALGVPASALLPGGESKLGFLKDRRRQIDPRIKEVLALMDATDSVGKDRALCGVKVALAAYKAEIKARTKGKE
jgi:transcriptional regulator with XRE-family HTH domain